MFFNFKKKDGGKIINSIQLTEAVWKTHDEAEIKKLVYEHGADEINYLIKLILRDANFETKNLSDKSIDILRMIEDSGKDYDRYELARYYIFMDRFALDYTGKTADMCFKYICNDEDFASGLIGYVSGNRLAYYANQKDKLEMIKDNKTFDVLYHVEENVWNNVVNIQLNVKDIRPSNSNE